jgi:hypothetical protein
MVARPDPVVIPSVARDLAWEWLEPFVGKVPRCARDDGDAFRHVRPHPPAIAATTVISSPGLTTVAKPFLNRMSSSFR